MRRYCPANYKLSGTTLSKDEDRLTLTAIPYLEGLPVYSAAIQFVFENNVLVSASGYFVPSSAVQTDSAEAITKCSAVIYLIDNCNEQGRICNTITEVSTGYILQSTASVPLLLTPGLPDLHQYLQLLCKRSYGSCDADPVRSSPIQSLWKFFLKRFCSFLTIGDFVIAFARKNDILIMDFYGVAFCLFLAGCDFLFNNIVGTR